MNNKPEDATHYSPSRDEYFSFDNAVFIWNEELDQWIEHSGIIHIGDLEEIK